MQNEGRKIVTLIHVNDSLSQAFKNYVENPSWLAVKSLHDTYLTTSQCPTMESFPRAQSANTSSESAPPRRIHLQTIQLAVAYQHLLDTVPRLHSTLPSSPHAKPWLDKNNDQDGSSGNGESYPNGYRVKHQNYDIILHVGVGLKGKLAVETTGHKRGYRLKDSTDLKCPAFRDQSGQDGIERIESDAEKMERLRLEVERDIDQVVRGFDEGYEAFEDLEVIEIDAVKLIDWLKNKGVPVSMDHLLTHSIGSESKMLLYL